MTKKQTDKQRTNRFSVQHKDQVDEFSRALEETVSDSELQSLLREKLKPAKRAGRLPKRNPRPVLELDLHGCTSREAEMKTASFIMRARGEKVWTVRIITGKGLHSEGQPVLPDTVQDVLRTLKKRELVHSWRWERGSREKSGALLVQLAG